MVHIFIFVSMNVYVSDPIGALNVCVGIADISCAARLLALSAKWIVRTLLNTTHVL